MLVGENIASCLQGGHQLLRLGGIAFSYPLTFGGEESEMGEQISVPGSQVPLVPVLLSSWLPVSSSVSLLGHFLEKSSEVTA